MFIVLRGTTFILELDLFSRKCSGTDFLKPVPDDIKKFDTNPFYFVILKDSILFMSNNRSAAYLISLTK